MPVIERTPGLELVRITEAAAIAASHWTQDPATGGGRIIGEACHFIDLLQWLAGSPPTRVYAQAAVAEGKPILDEVVISISFADGSAGTVLYTAGGDRSFGKERIEAFSDGRLAVLDDFHSLELVGSGQRTRRRERLRPDKGHRGEWRKLVEAASAGAAAPIPMTELVASHLAAYAAVESPRGEYAVYAISDGTDQPFRLRIHDPSFVHLQSVPLLMPGNLVADTMAIMASLDPIMGGVDK